MLASQFILPALIIFIIYKTLRGYWNKKLSRSFTAIWIFFWFIILFFIFQPNFLSGIANRIGVGRGVDLAIYISVIALFYTIYRVLVKIDELDKKITQVIRNDAIKNARMKKE